MDGEEADPELIPSVGGVVRGPWVPAPIGPAFLGLPGTYTSQHTVLFWKSPAWICIPATQYMLTERDFFRGHLPWLP